MFRVQTTGGKGGKSGGSHGSGTSVRLHHMLSLRAHLFRWPAHLGGGGGTTTTEGTTTWGGFKLGGTNRNAVPFSNGGGKIITISQGQPFAGRQMGGATRAQIYGSRRFGSDYPPNYAPGLYKGGYVQGRGFPHGFWPIYWG
jgi:hypothetical protein